MALWGVDWVFEPGGASTPAGISDQCGKQNGDKPCPQGQCCSDSGTCDVSPFHCRSDCQSGPCGLRASSAISIQPPQPASTEVVLTPTQNTVAPDGDPFGAPSLAFPSVTPAATSLVSAGSDSGTSLPGKPSVGTGPIPSAGSDTAGQASNLAGTGVTAAAPGPTVKASKGDTASPGATLSAVLGPAGQASSTAGPGATLSGANANGQSISAGRIFLSDPFLGKVPLWLGPGPLTLE